MPSSILADLETRVVDRLRELQPMHDEFVELRDFAKRNEIAYDNALAPAAAKPKPKAKPARKPRKARAKKAPAVTAATASGPGRREIFLAEIRKEPGLAIKDYAAKMGIGDTSLYKLRQSLIDDGLVRRDDLSLFPVEGTNGNGHGDLERAAALV